jgi:hypothetical protein
VREPIVLLVQDGDCAILLRQLLSRAEQLVVQVGALVLLLGEERFELGRFVVERENEGIRVARAVEVCFGTSVRVINNKQGRRAPVPPLLAPPAPENDALEADNSTGVVVLSSVIVFLRSFLCAKSPPMNQFALEKTGKSPADKEVRGRVGQGRTRTV